MSKTQPVRIDRELYDDACATAAVQSRSAAQQLAHWARLGRSVEASPDFNARRVQEALAGNLRYDDLESREQSAVRAEWSSRIRARARDLRLDKVFESEGREYAELDEDGRVVIRKPAQSASAGK